MFSLSIHLLTAFLALVTAGCDQPDTQGARVQSVNLAPADTTGMVEQARSLLEEGRPWRAARMMQRYRLAAGDSLSPELQLLAARAEAGWDHWQAVDQVLQDTAALGSLRAGLGLYLLARGRDATGDHEAAARLYRRFLETAPSDRYDDERAAARLRLGLALLRADSSEAGRRILDEVADAMGPAGRWVEILEAEALAATGEATAARRAAQRFTSGVLGLRARRAQIEAARTSDDLDEARRLAREGYGWARSDGTKGEFKVAEARLAFAQGDTSASRSALRRAIALDEAGEYGQQAADLLRDIGLEDPDDHLASARVYAALGLHEEAADDFRAWLDSGAGSPPEREEVRFALARTLIAGQMYERALEVLEPLGEDPAARDLRASALSRAGETEEAALIYRQLAAEQQGDDAAAALYFAADAYQQGGDAEAARPLFDAVIGQFDGSRWMGLALMRLAGLEFLEGNHERAAELWDSYRQRYPNGPLALQSTYWAARARAEIGQQEEARELFREVRRTDRDSYYALKASERLGEPFWPLPMREAPDSDPAAERRVAGWLQPVDRLREADYHEAAAIEVARIVDRAGGSRAVRYALAEALIERGYTQRAIRIGLSLQTARPNPRLLRILYPYPYRELIRAEAEDRGFPSTIAAALVRQESMFEARITSHVGARGLMQIMPATGAELADAYGLEEWDADYLYEPEISAFLGTGYIAENLENYEGSLPAVFSAYNAGPHQVEQWKTFPEFEADAELFTERIPFRETRDYVKKLTRNRAIYEGLYRDSTANSE